MLGSIIGGIGQLFSGLHSQRSAQKNARREQRRAQAHANLQAKRARNMQRNELRRARRFNQRQNRIQRAAEDRAWRRAQQAASTAYSRNKHLADTQIRRTVADAKAAGINPLVALGASTSPAIAQAVTPQSSTGGGAFTPRESITANYVPGQPVGGDPYSQGIATLAGAFDMENRGLQNELLRAQIRQSDAYTARMLATATSRTDLRRAANNALDPRTSYSIAGFDVNPHPTTSDIETIAGRLGEGAEWLALPFIAGLDYSHNYRRLKGHVHNRLKARGITRNQFGTYQFFKP